jgi:hypothetical protein
MRRLSEDEWIERSNIVHNFKYDYSEVIYLGWEKKVKIICPDHGYFEQKAGRHIRGSGCSKCNGGVLFSKEDWLEKVRVTHGDFYDYSKVDFQGVKKKVIIICPIHGEFQQLADNHFINGCIECGYDRVRNHHLLSNEEFKVKANELHNNYYNYDLIEYLTSVDKIKIICPKHGVFEQIPNSHLNGHGCFKCSSFSSRKERHWLDVVGVPDSIAHRNVSLVVNGKRYKVDGMMPGRKIIYEFLGDYWHGNPAKYKPEDINVSNNKSYGELFRLTIAKIRNLRDAGYEVISIWESEYDKKFNPRNSRKSSESK